jgi:NSS family neurotransmitter:Na+ symporter
MSQFRDSFHSRLGFVLSAAGSAIGLGNIWGFPTQVANNGGGAFLLVYLIVTLLLAFPALYAEVYIGNHHQKNPVSALTEACRDFSPRLGHTAGIIGLIGAILMLSFYSIVAGWMVAHALAPMAELLGFQTASQWLETSSTASNLVFTPLFILLGAAIIHQGVHQGIEAWSRRLMPLLLVMLIGLIIYILQLDGASEGLAHYLQPNFKQLNDPKLIISAMGQAFFSLSLGVGGMMVYGSYLKKEHDISKLAISITALDTTIAFLAGLLIIPALFVAQHAGQQIFVDHKLIGEGELIFKILPHLFDSMGSIGLWVAISFFILLSIAALTSTISSTEVPVAYLVEAKQMSRTHATWIVSSIVLLASLTIISAFDPLFGMVIQWVTKFQLPLMGLFYFIVVGWIWHQGNRLSRYNQQASKWLKAWAWYLRFICPILLTLVFINVAILG